MRLPITLHASRVQQFDHNFSFHSHKGHLWKNKILVTESVACSIFAVIMLQNVRYKYENANKWADLLRRHKKKKIDNDKRRLYSSEHFALCIGFALHIIINCSSEIDNSYKGSHECVPTKCHKCRTIHVHYWLFPSWNPIASQE